MITGTFGALAFAALATTALAETKLTIATVNNGDMIRMQGLTSDFTAKNPDISVEWVTLEENVLRQKVTTDIATKGGQFDVLTIGTYEVPIWAKKGWLVPLDNLGPDSRRSVDGRQTLRRAILWRELDGHVPQGPVREGGTHHAGRTHLGVHRRGRPQDR
jgi:ABC-type glycerol-3-phosphate transport system substrate-binding protein